MKETKKQSNGLYLEGWHSNGIKTCSLTFIYGKRDGLAEWWYANGVKSYPINYKDGERETEK